MGKKADISDTEQDVVAGVTWDEYVRNYWEFHAWLST